MKKFLALKASAGSGKTFALTVRYITLLLKGARPTEILTLTFTNKAANEMSERIYKTLQTLGDDEAYLNAIMKESALSKEAILGQKQRLISNFRNAELSIYTIDKFVNKILREFCGYIGISDDFEIREDDVEHLSYHFLKQLELEQFDKLIDFSLYEAKKFNSIFDLFKTLLEKNEAFDIVNIDSSLLKLQKKEAMHDAYKIKEHILNCNAASKSALNAVSFDSFDELMHKGKSWLAKTSMFEYSYFKKCATEDIDAVFQSLRAKIADYYKLRGAYSLSSLYELYLSFRSFKKDYNKDKNYLEFNDISNLVHELLDHKIEKDFLYFRLDAIYNHMLIDEFQDTSLLQFKILKPLIDEILSSGDAFKTFFYVGDTKQSIYRFRGGKRELFDYVSQNYPQIEVEILNTNYRSTQNVVNYVNDLFLKVGGYEYYAQESIAKGGLIEVIEDEAFEEDEKFKNIASKIAELFKQGVNANSIAILTYTNDDVLTLYSYLSQKFPNLDISTEMTSRLINQENVKALINAVKYLYYKEDIYKENLNAIIGNDLLSPFDFELDLKNQTVQQIVQRTAQVLNIIDDNVIRFIEICASYEHIVDFVFHVDRLEESILNAKQKGLQILTIFKSKGLEFDTVILLDRIKRKTPDKSTLLFEYDKVNLQQVHYKISGLDAFDEKYQHALEKEKSLVREDELNILYVAMTRAKNNLFVYKKHKSSVFDLLSIAPLKLGQLIISSDIKNESTKVHKVSYTPLDLGRQHINIKQESEKDHSLHARYFGLATHYTLEMMNAFDTRSLAYALGLSKSRYANYLKEQDFEDITQRVKRLLNNDYFVELISKSEFLTEQAVLYKGELRIIDLLLKINDSYIIFDYKTTQEMHDEHISQVNHYKNAIKKIFQTQKVAGFVLYLKEDEIFFKEV